MLIRIPKEKRDEILSKARAGEKVIDLTSQYGISDKTIYGWIRVDSSDDVVSLLKYNKLKRENEELKWLIGELTLDLKRKKKIELLKAAHIKTLVAQLLGICRKVAYYTPKQPAKDEQLASAIRQAHATHTAYGQKRMALHLKVNHKRTERVMRRFKIRAPRGRNKHHYCTASTSHHHYSN